jgi:hypothetical protein
MCRGDEDWYDRRNMPGRIDDVGVSVATSDIIPRMSPDIMSYCHTQIRWCSVQFYDAIFDVGVI